MNACTLEIGISKANRITSDMNDIVKDRTNNLTLVKIDTN